jgi:hypothetical protein
MSSGPQDSANTLYFNNTHYNDTDEPIPSYHKSDLRATFITNGGNYQVAINKLKLTSLDGVQMGTIPIDQWEMGLEVEDKTTGNVAVQLGYVSKTGAAIPIGQYEEYYALPLTSGQVSLYQSNGNLPPNQILTFQPVDSVGNNVYPLNAFYDYNKQKFWVISVTGVYLYNNLGVYITNSPFANLVNGNYNVEHGVLIVCNSDYENTDFSVVLLTENNNVISINAITTNHDGQPLTNLTCADTDGTLIIVCYASNKVTTYNYFDRSSIVDRTLANTTSITNILVDSENNKFSYVDDNYIPYLMVSSNDGLGYGINNPNWYDIETGDQKITNLNMTSTVSIADLYQFGNEYSLSNSTVIANTSYNNLNIGTTWNTFVSSNSCVYLSAALNTNNSSAILMGLQYTANSDLQVFTKGADDIWTNEYTISSAGGLYSNSTVNMPNIPQIVQDPFSKNIYVVFGEQVSSPNNFKILKTTTSPTISTARPCFTYSSTWQEVQTNINVDSMCIDPNYPNVFWAVNDNVIYKGYLVGVNFINFVVWYKNNTAGQLWKYYITQPVLSANYNPVQIIYQNRLSDFSNIDSINSQGNDSNYTYIQQAIRKNLLYVVNGNVLSKYNYSNLNFVSNVVLPIQTGYVGQTTSYLTEPTNIDNKIYSMGEFLTSFNNTFNGLFNLFSDKNISVKTAPYITCDYTTKFGTLNFDVNWADAGYGIYVNDKLYKYLKFPAVLVSDTTSPFYGMYKYTLNPTGTLTQSQYSLYLLNQIDKLLVLSNLPILGDFQGTITQTRIFTDLDLDTQDIFFSGSGNILYDPQLLRKYDIVSNTQINQIQYEFKIQYKNGENVPYYIPPNENVSIKLEFDRVY